MKRKNGIRSKKESLKKQRQKLLKICRKSLIEGFLLKWNWLCCWFCMINSGSVQNDAPKGRGTRRGYTEPPYYFQTPDMYHEWDSKSDAERGRDLDRMGGRMYYTEPMMSGYDKAKRHYTESKEMHKGNSQSDKEQKMRDLEAYMKELSGDVTEILSDMTPEERTLLKAKMTTLLQKIG